MHGQPNAFVGTVEIDPEVNFDDEVALHAKTLACTILEDMANEHKHGRYVMQLIIGRHVNDSSA